MRPRSRQIGAGRSRGNEDRRRFPQMLRKPLPIMVLAARQTAAGSSSSMKPRVLFGSTGMPGPMVVVIVAFLT